MGRKLDEEIGQMIREARNRAGMTQLQVANKLGYESMQFVSLFERGLSKVPLNKLAPLGKILPTLSLSEIGEKLKENYCSDVDNAIRKKRGSVA